MRRGSLPLPFQQGCLWGVLQGAISALLLLVFKHDVFFYLGIAEGLLFYLLAGFFTTRYGGAVTRALRATAVGLLVSFSTSSHRAGSAVGGQALSFFTKTQRPNGKNLRRAPTGRILVEKILSNWARSLSRLKNSLGRLLWKKGWRRYSR